MQGLGNDYVYIDVASEGAAAASKFLAGTPKVADLARQISDRHFGVGADGLILIKPPRSRHAACRMEMYNADGSRAGMCGNGLRCVAKYAFDHGLVEETTFVVDTDAGARCVSIVASTCGRESLVEVDMGPPELRRGSVPFVDGGAADAPAIDVPLQVGGTEFRVTTVSMGNPHAVTFLPSQPQPLRSDSAFARAAALPYATPLAGFSVTEWGPRFENHPSFPERTNVEFVSVISPTEIELRVWERGSGETLACGTGACAVLVSAVLSGRAEPEATLRLRGGELKIRWENPGLSRCGAVHMTGPAVEVFAGAWPYSPHPTVATGVREPLARAPGRSTLAPFPHTES